MGFSIGIVGLPNVGKSTLFKALTKQKVDIAPYPFTTINPNVGKVFVPDERLLNVAQIIKPEKTTLTTIEFIDIAGLVKGSHKGEGLGNQFLAQIRNCDAIVEIVRTFKNDRVEHIEKEINPKRDLEIIELELLMKDLEIIEKNLQKLDKETKSDEKEKIKKFNLLKEIKENLSKGKRVSDIYLSDEDKKLVREFQFLTEKPIIYLFNIGESDKSEIDEEIKSKVGSQYLTANLKLEEEISELSENEIRELNLKSLLDRLILICYNTLNLITFFTITGGKETRAWTIERGIKIAEAAGKVHSDFQEKFIKAEVISWQKFLELKSWKKAKELGQIQIVGRDYIVKDGDIIEFKI